MRVLVVGASGLLGSNVVAAALEREATVVGTYHSAPSSLDIEEERLDLREHDHIGPLCSRVAPDLIVNCAATTDVDGCEEHQEEALAVNAEAPGVLAQCATGLGAAFVHVSTDYVFDGTSDSPYPEDATPNPVQVYGETKLGGDRAVLDAHDSALVVRLSFVYGVHRSTGKVEGFPAWIDGRLAAGEEPTLFTDQHVTPTRAGFAAECLLDLVDEEATGVCNVACESCATPYEIGRLVAEKRGYDESLLAPGSMDDVDRLARRPRYTCLDTTKLGRSLDRPVPDLASELAGVFGIR